jgi:sialic acid synthase SpsE/mannose-6-phosphate isomerase-like protein (cupin superfamily)
MANRVNFENLFILEMANNHQGDVEHGMEILRQFRETTRAYPFTFCVKFQYRFLDTFVHPDYVNRKDIKLIKRFTETILSPSGYKQLKDFAASLGFLCMCTPFDEKSVPLIVDHGFDIIKVPSCYFNDWPLLEQIVKTDLPIIASTAGARLDDIDQVVSFFQHRKKRFALMHCVGEYPTDDANLQMNQIELLRKRYEGVPVGFSTHELATTVESVKIAIAKGAALFEKHVGLRTPKYPLNAYSSDPQQYDLWLRSAVKAFEMCGISGARHPVSQKEEEELRALYRGMYAKRALKKGENLSVDNVFFAMPNADGQIVANEFSKYTEMTLKKGIAQNASIFWADVGVKYLRSDIMAIIARVQRMLASARVVIPNQVDVEISHHRGIESFNEWGAVIINIVNRDYCKKLIVMLPGQSYPLHHHRKKDETMHVLYGDLAMEMSGQKNDMRAGDIVTIEKNTGHSFSTKSGVILEEISTTYFIGDSYYDEDIPGNEGRKTYLTYWSDWSKMAEE